MEIQNRRLVYTQAEIRLVWEIAAKLFDPSTHRHHPCAAIAREFTLQTGQPMKGDSVSHILHRHNPDDRPARGGLQTRAEVEASKVDFWTKRLAAIEAAYQARYRRKTRYERWPLVKQLLWEYRTYKRRWNRQEAKQCV